MENVRLSSCMDARDRSSTAASNTPNSSVRYETRLYYRLYHYTESSFAMACIALSFPWFSSRFRHEEVPLSFGIFSRLPPCLCCDHVFAHKLICIFGGRITPRLPAAKAIFFFVMQLTNIGRVILCLLRLEYTLQFM